MVFYKRYLFCCFLDAIRAQPRLLVTNLFTWLGEFEKAGMYFCRVWSRPPMVQWSVLFRCTENYFRTQKTMIQKASLLVSQSEFSGFLFLICQIRSYSNREMVTLFVQGIILEHRRPCFSEQILISFFFIYTVTGKVLGFRTNCTISDIKMTEVEVVIGKLKENGTYIDNSTLLEVQIFNNFIILCKILILNIFLQDSWIYIFIHKIFLLYWIFTSRLDVEMESWPWH